MQSPDLECRGIFREGLAKLGSSAVWLGVATGFVKVISYNQSVYVSSGFFLSKGKIIDHGNEKKE